VIRNLTFSHSSYFIKSELYTPHPRRCDVDLSDHGSNGLWKTGYAPVPVCISAFINLTISRRTNSFILANSRYFDQCVRGAWCPAHRVSVLYLYLPQFLHHIRDFNTAKGQMGVSTFLSVTDKGKRLFYGVIHVLRTLLMGFQATPSPLRTCLRAFFVVAILQLPSLP
jgi:hypothetical protein